ncbi:MAG TPA: MerR family transcriptional regulator [Polyangiaceae bacterium]|nr:MerR family transcriptional regulator [Polyangiaceae bacterium]
MAHKIGAVARLAHVSVRTLHHYDEIGLVTPSGRSAAGYRLYTTSDLERLQQVLFFRELGFALEAIHELLADPGFDRRSALRAQRAKLTEDAARANALVDLIDKTLRARERGDAMNPEEMFGGFDPSKYEDEARDRWGKSDSHAESMRRTKRYTAADWAKLGAEADAIVGELAEVMGAGASPDDPRAMEAAEKHRLHIARWFYACSHRMHVGLGDLYVADERFSAVYERRRSGLAAYLSGAIRANAERARASRASQ